MDPKFATANGVRVGSVISEISEKNNPRVDMGLGGELVLTLESNCGVGFVSNYQMSSSELLRTWGYSDILALPKSATVSKIFLTGC